MYILGLNHGEINSSAALYHNGKIIAAASEERFNRIKRTKSFPKQSDKLPILLKFKKIYLPE